MKKVYIKRNDLFKNINMVLFNNIHEADESFIEDNMHIFQAQPDDYDVDEEIENLSGIDWKKEEYKPYEIEDTMTPDEIKTHLQDFRSDIENDLEPHDLEPYQFFACNLDEWQIENIKSYGVDIGYSEKLDLSIIPIYDFGTSWSMFSYFKEVENDYTLAYNETLERGTVY